jgi:hypothetical protein
MSADPIGCASGGWTPPSLNKSYQENNPRPAEYFSLLYFPQTRWLELPIAADAARPATRTLRAQPVVIHPVPGRNSAVEQAFYRGVRNILMFSESNKYSVRLNGGNDYGQQK